MSKIPKPPLKKNGLIPKPPPKKNIAYTKEDLFSFKNNLDLPHALDLEDIVLGSILIDKKAIALIVNKINPNIFYDKRNKIIYQAIKSLYDDNIGIDILTVSNHLKKLNKLINIGGDIYLIELSTKIGSSAHIEYHCQIIIQKYILRELIINSSSVINECYNYNPDIFLLMDSIESNINKLHLEVVKNDEISNQTDALLELKEKMMLVAKGETSGIMSGIVEFDKWSGGFQKRELITIAARPGMGKSTAVLSIVKKVSIDNNIPTAFFSLEMAIADLKARLAAGAIKVEYKKIRNGTCSNEEFKQIEWYYHLIDESELELVERLIYFEQICKKIRDLTLNKGIKMAVIDYVQLIKLTRSTGDRTTDLAKITSGLKALANELNIPIIMVAQLSRAADQRTNKRPLLSDLKLSGSIEEDSDMVGFLLRMAYYQQTEDGIDLPIDVIGKCEFIIAKGRSTGTRSFWTFLDFLTFDFRSF